MIEEKQFKLILREPGRGDKELAKGSESFVAELRLKESLSHNPDHLVIEEVKEEKKTEENDTPVGEIILTAVSIALSFIILRLYGKRQK